MIDASATATTATDPDAMLRLLIRWADMNTGSRNVAGLNAMLLSMQEEFDRLGGTSAVSDLPVFEEITEEGDKQPVEIGRMLTVRKRPDADLQVLLGIHYDTVYPANHPFQRCTLHSDGRLQGPGVADAKGGIVVLLYALGAFEQSPWADRLGWEVVLNPDEEIGSPGSAPLLWEAAGRHDVGFLFEPALHDGTIIGSLKGSGYFTAVARGRAAHAGHEPHLGRNAINALAQFIVQLNRTFTDEPGIICNVGNIRGGGPANVVPELALCTFNIRVSEHREQQIVESRLAKLHDAFNGKDDVALELHGSFARPPKPLDDPTLLLLNHIADCGKQLGLTITWRGTGGASDGNILSAAGLPNVDGLGVRGGNLHGSSEYMLIDSLVERTRLTTLLLMRLAAGELVVPTGRRRIPSKPNIGK